ncbi:Peptide chain release factor 1 [Sedimentisphaera cyanobacteriorum]|uniref:Peptide chain release factor 1 n=1 Tax=Sedimentisphaera cyanobacteriorum TaxID=1940790 RepID=A0A1Q2HN18_9BACT|nr:peptide chain release factor 1 [Sedimentisphaera cyanobacteriorum]AQQ08654.1 Peptide chain release factor 1 [Sedimentisphaera cyanobacteriorum]
MSEDNTRLLEKLSELEARLNELDRQIQDPEIASAHSKLIPLTKEQAKLKPVVSLYREYNECAEGIKGSEEILENEQDPEMREMAEAEIEELEQRREQVLQDLKDKLVMADDAAIDSVIIEIRPGTGGDEAALFARDLFSMYSRYAEANCWKVETISFAGSEKGGVKEVVAGIKGPGVWACLGYEGGGHRVQRVPETETQGRIHTSAATVAIMPEPEDIEVDIKESDVAEHVSRAGGPGGQSVNKINSAIKLEHIPTGITVSMRDEKSQHKNRAKAWRILKSRIYEHFISQERAERDSQRKAMIGSGDRSQRIRTYNFPQNRVTDHRINLTLYHLDKIIMGELDEIVEALQTHDKQQRLDNI